MEVKAFRARSMQEALQLVRRTLGPDATLLQAREVRNGLLGWLPGVRQIEVLASADVQAPCRLPASAAQGGDWEDPSPDAAEPGAERNETRLALTSWDCEYRARFRAAVLADQAEPQSLVEELSRRSPRVPLRHWSEAAVCVYTDLLDAEVPEDLARELIERVCQGGQLGEIDDSLMLRARLARLLESEIQVSGPLVVQSGKTRVVALVGPTGVGKTTTLAKLAADYRLRQQRRVGLVTVDTYRIAAVEQLRTYADIIDVPMEVATTPRDMRLAIDRLSGQELILVDTAGRSPRDGVRIQELKSLLAECRADEVHLVLSVASGEGCLKRTAERFAAVGVTSLLLTKLDEAGGLGGLPSLLRHTRLPLSYLTHGQNVPADIEVADGKKLARIMVGLERA
ncbi:MAG: flagellar biosynthesis protein FlhF [Candidatus Anammoximicrobium sp.]|nr:flagellar biosynthesis protein FlhF [Candidatus Anammoximicrobium sp.]